MTLLRAKADLTALSLSAVQKTQHSRNLSATTLSIEATAGTNLPREELFQGRKDNVPFVLRVDFVSG